MRFGVLGPLAVWTDAGTPVVVPGAKVRALLADLLVHRGSLVTADRLIEDLWGADAPRRPLGALQVKVSQLRRALDGAEPGARGLLVSRGHGYVLDVPASAVDAGRFAELVAAARGGGAATAATRVAEALALWRGPAFADVADEEFAAPAIAELEELRLGAVELDAEARLELGEVDAVIGELNTLLDQHPLREKLQATRLRALYRAGRQAEALQRYDELRIRFRDELGLDPSPELVELHRAILTQERALDAPATPRTNLPATWDDIVGRDRDVADLRTVLATARLVTLTGPGGVGKTRLAVETARLLVPTTRDGVWMVDLSGLDAARGDAVGELAELVAATLDLHDDASTDPVRRIVDAIADRHVLLLLDNCEQIVEPAAELVAALLRRAPELRLLATSREPLGLRGEVVRPVQALDLPSDGADPAGSAAVQLFVARAAAVAPGFALTRDNAAMIAAVCRQLDGLPLALELAAARVRTLGLAELAARIDDRFRVLGSGPRDAPRRQRTLRAVMDWSWEPLSESERAVLRRLAVTADGCTTGLAEEVCAGEPVDRDDVLELLSRLVDRSLVLPVESGGGRTRYRLLETVAAYACERLHEAGEEEATRYRHAVACAELAERAAPRLRGPEQKEWLSGLDAETANMKAALDTAVARPDPALALRLVNALTWYWFLRGRHRTAGRSLAAALRIAGPERSVARAAAGAALAAVRIRERSVDDPVAHSRTALDAFTGLGSPGALAHARWLHAFVMSGIGELEAGEHLAASALATFHELGDGWGAAAALREVSMYTMSRGRLDEARRAGEESARLFDELGDRWGQASAAEVLGNLDEIAGDQESAARRHRDGLRCAEELQLWPAVIDHLSRLGRIAALTGEPALADDRHRRALELAREQGYESKAVYAQLGLGMVARRTGRFDEAAEHLTALHEWYRTAGYEPGKAISLAELGFLAEQRGDAETAGRLHIEGLDAARRSGDPRAVAFAFEGLAGERVLRGEYRHAARLLGAAAATRAGIDGTEASSDRGDVDRITAAARAALGEAFDAEFARGSDLDADAVLAERRQSNTAGWGG
ncbi:winged helix-turn-helix domain-containing protein [Pseudonocardia sp. DSM 110487]|uniref:BTAD domain-containing putative transcriptional regulator n=1 Tax=Pseudonocardia sp. DSM 110487 TaxID=2865833 RepID=UPI001C69F6DA|nr:BTAD domain-containing putative transcriptional regulator [Pseudonocardia sp. DSM 110487]QYN35930.1 winged helix-turn-helix domain-containing protein [Pseudonocardia sp. DSM 110487]